MWKPGERIPGYVETGGEKTWICGNLVREYLDMWKHGERMPGYVETW